MPDGLGRTLPGDWPSPRSDAHYHPSNWLDSHGLGWSGYGYVVDGVPPPPWPFIDMDGPFPLQDYGPPGTVWVFAIGDIAAAFLHSNRSLDNLVLRTLTKKLGWTVQGNVYFWRTPAEALPEGERMRWIRATVHGKLGSVEEVAHTFTLRTQPTPDADLTIAQVATIAGAIRDRWLAFLNVVPTGQTHTVKQDLSASLAYDEVRCAYLEQTAPGTKDAAGKMILPKPVYLVPTQYASFDATAKGGNLNTNDLPWEVACAVTLNTNVRGPSYRGRTYLGGLSVNHMGSAGMFNQPLMQAIAASFGATFINGVNANAGAQFQIVSRTHLHAAPVQGVRIGQVPDSQRRRRRKQPEAYVQAWGQAIGAVPPS